MGKSFNTKTLVILGAVLVATIGLGFGLSKVSNKQSSAKADASHIIELRASGASPDSIAVVKGSYVQFDVKDNRTYNIGQGSGDDPVHQSMNLNEHDHPKSAKESGIFGPGQGYRVTFSNVGTYTFHDHANPKISITVIVYEPKS